MIPPDTDNGCSAQFDIYETVEEHMAEQDRRFRGKVWTVMVCFTLSFGITVGCAAYWWLRS